MVNREDASVCPDIYCYVTTLRPQHLGHGIDYYKGRSLMSCYGLGNCFAKLFRSALPLAKNYIAPVAVDIPSSALHYRSSGKDSKESISQYIRSISGKCIANQRKLHILYAICMDCIIYTFRHIYQQ